MPAPMTTMSGDAPLRMAADRCAEDTPLLAVPRAASPRRTSPALAPAVWRNSRRLRSALASSGMTRLGGWGLEAGGATATARSRFEGSAARNTAYDGLALLVEMWLHERLMTPCPVPRERMPRPSDERKLGS